MHTESWFFLVLLAISVYGHYLQFQYGNQLLEVIQYYIKEKSWHGPSGNNKDTSLGAKSDGTSI